MLVWCRVAEQSGRTEWQNGEETEGKQSANTNIRWGADSTNDAVNVQTRTETTTFTYLLPSPNVLGAR